MSSTGDDAANGDLASGTAGAPLLCRGEAAECPGSRPLSAEADRPSRQRALQGLGQSTVGSTTCRNQANELSGFPFSSELPCSNPSAVQRTALDHLRRLYDRVPSCPEGLEPRESFDAICGSQASRYSPISTSNKAVPYDHSLVSWPEIGSAPTLSPIPWAPATAQRP